MPSSISRSDRRVPRLALTLLALGLLTWAADVAYTLRGNPELQFFSRAYVSKRNWAAQLAAENTPKTVIYGGSSSLFSIDTGRLRERDGIPAVNAAYAAGIGASVLTQAAIELVRAGDTLVVALEPVLLTDVLEPPAMGVQFSCITGHPEWFSDPRIGTNSVPWPSALLALRPGGYHTLTMLGKLLRRGPLYRYDLADLRPDGFLQTEVRVPVVDAAWHNGILPPASQTFLEALREFGRAHQVRIVYALPWSYCPPKDLERFQQLNARFLLQVARHLPVVWDPRLGAYPEAAQFADSGFHLNLEGSRIRTDELAASLRSQRVWTEAELKARVAGN